MFVLEQFIRTVSRGCRCLLSWEGRTIEFSIGRQLLHRNVKRLRGGLVFKAHKRLVCHSSLGWRLMKKKKKGQTWRRLLAAPSWLLRVKGAASLTNTHLKASSGSVASSGPCAQPLCDVELGHGLIIDLEMAWVRQQWRNLCNKFSN